MRVLRSTVFLGAVLWASFALADGNPPAAATPAPAPAASGAPAAAPAAGAPAASEAGSGDQQFDLRIKGIEEKVNDLKEKIFRTKSHLLLLQEEVLGGDISSSAKAVIYHANEMGPSYVLESAAYTLDGAAIYTKVDNNGDLADKPSFEIFNSLIVPGNHQITVKLSYRGHGFGVFSYLDGYKLNVQSSYTFNAEPGRLTVVKVVGFEKGNALTTDFKDRPSVRYDVEVSKEKPGQKAPGAAAAVPGATGTK